MWDVVSLVLFATKKCDVRVRLPSALQEFCCCLGTCSLIHHGLCTLWTAFTNDLTWILLALVAPFSRGYVPAFVGEYVPFFFPKGFLGFSYQADTLQISASPSQASARFAFLGLVVLILSLTSAPIGCLSPQVWLTRSTCVLGLRQSNWQF